MKKYLLTMLLLITLYATGSFAMNISISPQNTDLSASGQSFKIDVMISDVTDLGGFQFDILYDPAIVQVQGQENVTLGNFLKNSEATASPLGPVIDNQTGKLTFGAFTFGQVTGLDGSGVLASIVFTIKDIKNSFLNLDNVQLAAMTDGSSMMPESIGNAILTDGTSEPEPTAPEPVVPTPVHTISFTVHGSGNIEGTTKQNVEQGSSTSPVTAVPNDGYIFTGWTGDYTGTDNPLTITGIMTEMSIIANFAEKPIILPQTYNINFSAFGNGSFEGSTRQTIDQGTNAESVTAVPAKGYEFTGWTGDYTGTDNPLTITNVNSDMNITANFIEKTYTITITAETGGSIAPADNLTVIHGRNAEFAITPDAGYYIEDVIVDSESVGQVTSWNFTEITADHTIEALFASEEIDTVISNTEIIDVPIKSEAEPKTEPETETSDGGGGGCFIDSINKNF